MEQENDIQERPKLYSKTLILVFAIIFSTLFAAILLMINLRKIGEKSARIQVLIFTVLYMIATGVAIQALQLSPSLTIIFNVIGAAILNEYFWNKYIGDIEYEKRNWIKPTLVSLFIVTVMFLLLMQAM